jgi:ribonuclease-3
MQTATQPPPPNIPPPGSLTEDEIAQLPPRRLTEITHETMERVIGQRPMDLTHYDVCFTHPDAGDTYDYEKYEFLGDSVLNFVTAKFLWDKFPEANEGFLTITRTKLTRSDQLWKFSQFLGLEQFVKMSGSSIYNGCHRSKKTLEDVFEALVCAVYFDLGMLAAKKFILAVFDRYVDWCDVQKNRNWKDQLMQFQHAKGASLPTYVSERQEDKSFIVTIHLDGHVGIGRGKTKKTAEQTAAKDILIKFGQHVDD